MKPNFPQVRLAAAALALLAVLALQAQAAAPAARAFVPIDELSAENAPSPEYLAARKQWRGELDAFAASDSAYFPPPGGVVFVGSSSVRMWTHLAQDFPQLPATVLLNRGFGGSTMADCSLLVQELVVRYRPRQVVIYAGDNDLAEGRTPLQVLDSFARFANAVRAALPDARITYLSVKPSPSREQLLAQIRETNNAIGAYLNRLPNSEYVDVFTPMLGSDGRPRPELFRGDRLHMTEAGYRLWQSILAPHLSPPESAAATADLTPAR